MWNDPDVGRKTVMLVPVLAAGLVAGWFGVRGRVRAVAAERGKEF